MQRPRTPAVALVLAVALAVALVAAVIVQVMAAPPAPVRFGIVGDSVTAANSPDIGSGRSGTGSWTSYAKGGDVRFVGGWAAGGATTMLMAQNTPPIDADVLVIVAGTNDSGSKVPFAVTASNLSRIVQRAGVDRVVLSAIPPRDQMPGVATSFNTELRALAGRNDWTFADPMRSVRTSTGTYRPGFTDDGIHPTVAAARAIGISLRRTILAVAR